MSWRRKTGGLAVVVLVLGAVALVLNQFAPGISSKRPPAGQGVHRAKSQRRVSDMLKPVKGKIVIGVSDRTESNGKTAFESQVGRKVGVVARFQAWGGPPAEANFDRRWVEALAKDKKVPLITWEPWKPSDTDFDQPDYRLKAIASGAHDAYLRQWFGDAADWGRPLFVRFMHEMNGNWYPWGRHANSPRDFVKAWRHVVDIAREVGANNIAWVWSPNEIIAADNLRDYYPGDDYVDWIGMSGFNWGGGGGQHDGRWQQWRPFAEIFEPTLNRIKRYRKPIMIAEIGAIENPDPRAQPDQTKAAWIIDSFQQIKRRHPPIALIVWHNDIYRETWDWQVSTSSESVKATRQALSDPVFSGKF